MRVIVILLYLLSFLVIWQFVGYPSLMAVVAIRAQPKKQRLFLSTVCINRSANIPYNEAKVIEKRIKNLFELDYPKDKYEIIVVDSGSTDSKQRLLKKR